MKFSTLLGSVQLITFILALVKNKFVAIILGPRGYAYIAVVNSVIVLFTSIFTWGLNFEGVKNISTASKSEKKYLLNENIQVLFWVIFSSAVVSVLTFIIISFSLPKVLGLGELSLLDMLSVSLAIGLSVIGLFYTIVFNGTLNVREYAKSSVMTTLFSLLITVPIYYFYGIGSIPTVFFITGVFSVVVNQTIYKKLNLNFYFFRVDRFFEKSWLLIKGGGIYLFSGFLSAVTNMAIIMFLVNLDGLKLAGLYQAGISLIAQFTSVVFAIIITDFFPRLMHYDSILERNVFVNRQSHVMLFMSGSLIVVINFFLPEIISIGLSESFTSVVEFVKWYFLGTFVQIAFHPISLIPLARRDKKMILFLAFYGNLSMLLSTTFGYYYFGLDGIGFFFLGHVIISSTVVYFSTLRRYSFSLDKTFLFFLCFFVIFILISIFAEGYFKNGFSLFNKLIFSLVFLILTVFIGSKKFGINLFKYRAIS